MNVILIPIYDLQAVVCRAVIQNNDLEMIISLLKNTE